MRLINQLVDSLTDGEVREVRIGLNWTAVVVEVDGEMRCGLASTLWGGHKHTGEPTIPDAGYLIGRSVLEIAGMVKSRIPTRISLGMATINAAMLPYPEAWVDQKVEDLLASLGKSQSVCLVGHFPFVPRLRKMIERFDVIEREPLEGDHPEEAASRIIPQSDVVAITGMSLLNGTFNELISLCSNNATVLLVGPTTPMSPVMFTQDIDILAGSIVTDIEPVLKAVSQGANFRQVRKAGVRLVTINRGRFNDTLRG